MTASQSELDDLVVVSIEDSDGDLVVVTIEPDQLDGVTVVVVDDAPPSGEGAIVLGDLRDVDAPIGALGVLERQSDQVVRPVSRAALVAEHVHDPTPHPAYDDMVDPRLWFDNALI